MAGCKPQALPRDELPWCGELGSRKPNRKGSIYLRSFGESRWGIQKKVMFRCLEKGRFGLCPLSVKLPS